MSILTTCRASVSGLLLVVGSAQAQQLPAYNIVDIGSLGGYNTQGTAINASGQITGASTIANSTRQHAFIYSNGVMTDLGTLEGDANSAGMAINAAGQVTGQSSPPFPAFQATGFLYSNGVMTSIGRLGGGSVSSGQGINSAGVVAGTSSSDFYTRAVTYSNGVLTDIGGFATYNSAGMAINDAGQIAGNFDSGTQNCCVSRAFLYVDGVATDLGTFGGQRAEARAINSLGEVTGFATVFNDQAGHAFLYGSGTLTDLGALGGASGSSIGNGINAAGDVVGASSDQSGGQRAFLYSNGEMIDLNTLIVGHPLAQWVALQEAKAINDSGWIVANGKDSRTPQLQRAYLVAPRGDISITPRGLGFGSQTVSVAGTAKIMTIANNGSNAVTISSIAIEGLNGGDFSAADNCPRGRLAAGVNCTVSVRFSPTAAGDRTASLRIVSSAISNPDIVALAGTGTTPVATATPTPTAQPTAGSSGGGGSLDLLVIGGLLGGLLARARRSNHAGCARPGWPLPAQ